MKNQVATKNDFRTQAEKCAYEIIDFLIRHDMWQDTCIYVKGKRYSCYDGEHHQYDSTWDCVFIEEGHEAQDYVEYYSNFLTMTFEGPFYDIINYSYSSSFCDRLIAEFDEILKKYGKYYEQGYAWSLALYDL